RGRSARPAAKNDDPSFSHTSSGALLVGTASTRSQDLTPGPFLLSALLCPSVEAHRWTGRVYECGFVASRASKNDLQVRQRHPHQGRGPWRQAPRTPRRAASESPFPRTATSSPESP